MNIKSLTCIICLKIDASFIKDCVSVTSVLLVPCSALSIRLCDAVKDKFHACWCVQNKLSELSRVEDMNTVPEKLVHASIISSKDVKLCKRPNGEDWLLGRGSYGTVSHRRHYLPTLSPSLPFACVCLCSFAWPAVSTAVPYANVLLPCLSAVPPISACLCCYLLKSSSP